MEMEQERITKGDPEEENFGETKKPDVIRMAMQKLTRKIFELDLFERMARETELKLRQKEKEVAKEKRKFDELQYEKFAMMEAFCDKIWKFSSLNDLCTVFNKYLDMPKPTHCNSYISDIERDPEILKMKNENEQLKKQLDNKNLLCQNLEENLMQSEIQLEIAESYRENDPEIIRFTENIEKFQKNIQALESKIAIIEREIIDEERRLSIISPAIGDKRFNFVTASELIEKSKMDDTIKRPKFSVKKSSGITRKFANTHGTNRCS